MTSNSIDRDEALELLTCDITARPADAPSLDEIAPSITAHARRSETVLELTFASAARDQVAAAVAAERLCCAEIDWTLELDPAPRLRISGTPAQISLLAQLLGADTDVTRPL